MHPPLLPPLQTTKMVSVSHLFHLPQEQAPVYQQLSRFPEHHPQPPLGFPLRNPSRRRRRRLLVQKTRGRRHQQ